MSNNITLFNNTLDLNLFDFTESLKNNLTKNFRLEKIASLIYILSNNNLDKANLFINSFESLKNKKIDLENYKEVITEKTLKNYFTVQGKFYLSVLKIVLEFPQKEFENINLEKLINNENKYISKHLDIITNKLDNLKNTNHLTILASTGAGKTTAIIELFKTSKVYNKLVFLSPLSKLNKQTFNSAKKSENFKTYIAIGKDNRQKLLNSDELDFVVDDTNFLEVLTNEEKVFLCADNFYYRYFFKNGKLKKQFENLKNVLIVVDEYDKVYNNLVKVNNNEDTDENEFKEVNKYNIFNCAIKDFKYLFLTATPIVNKNKEVTATNVLDFRTMKNNIKNLYMLNKKDFNNKLLEAVKTGGSLGYYTQNAGTLESFKKSYKKYYLTKTFRVSDLEKNQDYHLAVNHNNNKVNKNIKDDAKVFDYIVENENIIDNFCLCFTSCISAGYSIQKDVKNLFLDVSTLTDENSLIQLMGRFRGNIENLYITIREKELILNTEDFKINNNTFTMKCNQLQNTNINLQKLNNNDTGYLVENELLELLKTHKYIFKNIYNEVYINTQDKLLKDKQNKKDFIEKYSDENGIKNFKLKDIFYFGYTKKDFTNFCKFENKVFSDFTISKNDLITAIERKYPLDFKEENFILAVERNIKKYFKIGEKYILKTEIKKVFNEGKILKFVKDNYFKHYKKINMYVLIKTELEKDKNINIKFNGNLSKYITCNVNYLDNILPIFLKTKNTSNNRSVLEVQGYKTVIINNLIYADYTEKLNNKINIVTDESLNKDIFYFGSFNENIFLDYIKNNKTISIDIETKSLENEFESIIDLDKKFLKDFECKRLLQPYYSYISNINFYSEKGFLGFELDKNKYIENMNLITKLLKNKVLIFHNVSMEFNFLKNINVMNNLVNNKNTFQDTLLLFKSIMINQDYSLKDLSFCFAGDTYDEKGNFYDLKYMFKDVYYTYHLFLYFHKHLKDIYNDIKFIYKNDLYFLTNIISQPIEVDKEKLLSEYEKGKKLFNELSHIVNDYVTPLKLKKYYIEKYNIKLLYTKKQYLEKILKDDLEGIKLNESEKNEIINFLDFKKIQKYLTDLKILSIKNLSISYNKVITGRWSTSSPNLQGFTKNNFKIRDIEFLSMKKLLVNRFEKDFSQQEIAVEGSVYNNQVKKDIVNKGLDLHSLTTGQLFNLDYNYILKNKDNKEINEKRQIGKTFNFQIGYGAGVSGLYKSLKEINKNLTLEDTEIYYQNYYENNKVSKICKNESLNFILSNYNNFIITNRFGRVRFYLKFRDKGFISNQVLNYNIQSSSADLTTLCAVECMKQGLKVNSTVHDAIYFTSKKDAEKGEKIMLEVAKKYFKDITGWKID